MELMATYLQERLMDLNWYIESETDTLKEILNDQNAFLMESLDSESDFLAGVTQFESSQLAGKIELLLNHFEIPSETRRLDDSRPAENSDNYHQESAGEDARPHLLSATGTKKDMDPGGGNCSSDLHKVQIEILSSTNPRSFVCGVLRHEDAGVSLKVLRLEKLDVVTRTKLPNIVHDVVDLGGGALLVDIHRGDKDEASTNDMYFITVGLIEDVSQDIVAKHTLIVSFP
mmetsp:Transcript_57678/g.86996  ORF Transcript_57678/g.86996 Transcript_57678/m.86996 type:complete len:230 (+) Transcript_57678:460-1149(+)